MSAASNYTENNVINSLLRGAAFPVSPGVYLSLHTADPNDVGAAEVAPASWPSYVRRDSTVGDTLANAWTPPADGVTSNAKQVLYPSQNGASSITLTHFGLWDAANGGNFLAGAALYAPRTLNPGDVFVFDVASLTVRML
ncbi:phage tail fiber protein [Paraburkholderia hospita]|uniref:phage tail fiber protein n=1 Tax=Paraburkholderia hospita TaxID=169430 RepID=UPI0008A77922|nr:hypothetical protein [Paraburkholderia hospita]SEH89764.1 hypothetical protein SAMN05192544_1011146 [Paraburkholderia hospita]